MKTPGSETHQLPEPTRRRAATNVAGGQRRHLTASPTRGQDAARQAAHARARLLMSVHTGERPLLEVCELAAEGIVSARKLQFRQLLLAATNWSASRTDTAIAALLLDTATAAPSTRITVGWVADRPRLMAAVRLLVGIDEHRPDPYHPFTTPSGRAHK